MHYHQISSSQQAKQVVLFDCTMKMPNCIIVSAICHSQELYFNYRYSS